MNKNLIKKVQYYYYNITFAHTKCIVAINRETKEIELPQNLNDKVKDPNYYVCYCHKDKKGKYIIQKIEETDL